MNHTFEELAKDKVSTLYDDFVESGIRCRILRGPCVLAAYLGIPPRHLLAGKSYDDIPLDCHGGLTFGQEGGKKEDNWPAGYYWYGWDYGHSGDKPFYALEDDRFSSYRSADHGWTVEEVRPEVVVAAWNMRKLLDLYASPWERFKRWLKDHLKT